jgi:hypothetical protein
MVIGMKLTREMKIASVLDYYTKGQDGRYGDIMSLVHELISKINNNKLTDADEHLIWTMYYDKI